MIAEFDLLSNHTLGVQRKKLRQAKLVSDMEKIFSQAIDFNKRWHPDVSMEGIVILEESV